MYNTADNTKRITWVINDLNTNKYKNGWNYISLNFSQYSDTNKNGYRANTLNNDSVVNIFAINYVDEYANQSDVNGFYLDDIRICKNNPKTVGILQSFSNVGTFIWGTVKSVFNVITVNPILIFGFALIAIGASIGLVSRLRNG